MQLGPRSGSDKRQSQLLDNGPRQLTSLTDLVTSLTRYPRWCLILNAEEIAVKE